MADMTLEEALAAATVDEELVMPVNEVLLINPETRTINVPDSEKLFGARQDMNAERKYFKCPRIVGDNIDLFEHRIFVNYVPSKRDGSYDAKEEVQNYWCRDLAVEGDFVTFSWKLSENAMRSAGYIAFAVYAKAIDEYGNLQTKWHTTIAIGNVLDTLPDGEEWITVYPDIVMQLLERMDEVEKTSSTEMLLDRNLKDSTKAAPADIVGKLSEDIADLKENGTGGGSNIETNKVLGDLQRTAIYPCSVIYLDGDTTGMTKEDSVMLDMILVDEYGNTAFDGKSETSWQGSGSLQYPNKNLSLKLKDKSGNKKKIKVFSDYEASTYHLKCNYADYSMVRNSVGARMAMDFDDTIFPVNAPLTVRSIPVIVYLNGSFNGCYTLNLKQDDSLFGMDSETNPLTHIVYRSGLNGWSLGNFEYRSDGTETAETKAKLQRLLDFCANSDAETFVSEFENHMDLNNAINYWLFAELACASDNLLNNFTLATWDGSKWYMIWYDLDIIFGLFKNANLSYHPSKPTTDLLPLQYTTPNPIWQKLYDNFFDEIKERYWIMRNSGMMNPSVLVNKFRTFQTKWSTENIEKERAKWTGRLNKTDDIDTMYSWILERLEYLDSKYVNPIPATNITFDKSTLTFEEVAPQTITATVEPPNTTDKISWVSSDTQIAVVENGVVTPISNGNCTISATVGNYSATCAVTVNVKEKAIFSITRNLVNCISNSEVLSVAEGSSHEETLNALAGYAIEKDNVTITMDGVDITESSFDENVISIESVTGNIVINATATEEVITLPTGYTRVGYIGSSGTQYLDTEKVFRYGTDGKDYEFYLDFALAKTSGTQFVFGSVTNSGGGDLTQNQLIALNATALEDWKGNYLFRVDQYNVTANDATHKAKAELDKRTIYKLENNAISLIDCETEEVLLSGDITGKGWLNVISDNTIYFMAKNTGNGPESGTMGSIKVYEFYYVENNVKVLHLIPVLDANGVACMYDVVSKKTHYNKGTGTFTYGE